jgi:hypothetical protein
MVTALPASGAIMIRLCAIVASVAATTCWDADTPQQPYTTLPTSLKPPASFSQKVMETPREALDSMYRLAPDRRFVTAFDELATIVGNTEAEPAAVDFDDEQWTVTRGGSVVAVLPRFPDFTDALAALVADAKKTGRALELKGRRTAKGIWFTFPLVEAISGLETVDQRWSLGRKRADLFHAARLATSVVFQLLDSTEHADRLVARALALVALAKAQTKANTIRQEVALAEVMGYSAASRRRAKRLPRKDPLRLFVNRDDGVLAKLATRPNAPPATRFLWYKRLVRLGNLDNERGFWHSSLCGQQMSLSVLSVRADMKFREGAEIASAMPWLILAALARDRDAAVDVAWTREFEPACGGEPDLETAVAIVGQKLGVKHVMKAMAAGLRSLDKAKHGALFDVELHRMAYIAITRSMIHRQGLFLLDTLNSVDAAKAFDRRLAEVPAELVGPMVDWYRRLRLDMAGKTTAAEMMSRFGQLDGVGAQPLWRLFEAIRDRAQWGAPEMFVATRALANLLDTRPSHRRYLGYAANDALFDVRLAGELWASAVAAAPGRYPALEVIGARREGNLEKLDALARIGSQRQRLRALRYLQREKIDPKRIAQGYRELLEEDGSQWEPVNEYVTWLIDREEYGEGQTVISGWLDENSDLPGLAPLQARTKLARLYHIQQQHQKAWELVEPDLASQYGGSMWRGALVLVSLERHEEAKRLAQARLKRYPNTGSTRLLAETLWRIGQNAEAAGLLRNPPRKLRARDWRKVGAAFVAAFGDTPQAGAAAFNELREAGVSDWSLKEIVAAVGEAGHPRLAFDLGSGLSLPGAAAIELFMANYRYLEEAEGEEKAVSWLDAKVPPQMRSYLPMFLHRDRKEQALWQLADLNGAGEETEFAWLMAAATHVLCRCDDTTHEEQLRDHYSVDGTSHYHSLGQYLMRKKERQEVGVSRSWAAMTEAAYVFAVRAQSEGRMEDASDWLRVVTELGQVREGEYRWAYSRLHRWATSGKSLARVGEANPCMH